MLAPAPTVVRPSSWVAWEIRAPGSIRTFTSIQVLAGSTMVTPAAIQCASCRSLRTRRALASWVWLFTPWISSKSGQNALPTR